MESTIGFILVLIWKAILSKCSGAYESAQQNILRYSAVHLKPVEQRIVCVEETVTTIHPFT